MAIVFLFSGQIEKVPYCVAICLIADFSDGFFARALKVNSPIGPDLDSLADMVSFGALPGLILFYLIDSKMGGKMMEHGELNFVAMTGFMVTLFSALRLAKFNVDDTQATEFSGLATPAATIFIVGILILENGDFDLRPANYVMISIGLSYLLVSRMRMFSFKISSLGWKDSGWQYTFIALSLPVLIWLKFASLSLIIVIYVLLNLIKFLVDKKKSLA